MQHLIWEKPSQIEKDCPVWIITIMKCFNEMWNYRKMCILGGRWWDVDAPLEWSQSPLNQNKRSNPLLQWFSLPVSHLVPDHAPPFTPPTLGKAPKWIAPPSSLIRHTLNIITLTLRYSDSHRATATRSENLLKSAMLNYLHTADVMNYWYDECYLSVTTMASYSRSQ